MFTRSIRFAVTLLIVGLSMVAAQPASAQASTTADVVYGQLGSFTTGTANDGGISANSLDQPTGVTLDSSGNLYVADIANNRVLFYPSGSTTATRVYGQGGSFITNTPNNGGVSANSLYQPYGVVLDSSGNLYVADLSNSRVLFYPSGSTTATRVYGQFGNFTTNTPNNGGISANSLFVPAGVALDSSGNLYVADHGSSRVLFYPSGSTTATGVYGQLGGFTTGTENTGVISANSLYFPLGVTLDSSGNLYVADTANSRVLFYPSGSTTATRVYGQGGSFTTKTANNGGISANSLYYPKGVALDSSGNLYASDFVNNRVLFYPSGSTTATGVYGQLGRFTTNTINNGGISANSLYQPYGVVLDSSGNLYVADTANNRVLMYPPTTTPGIYSPVNQSTLAGNSVTFWWAAYPGASNYWLDIGSSSGGNNYLQSGALPGSQYSLTANNLPSDGSMVYVTWWYEVGGSWSYTEYQYTAFSGSSQIGVITSPTPNSTLTGGTVTFTWTAGTQSTAYWIDAGSVPGGNQYYQSGNLGNVLSATVPGLPTNGSTVYITLWSQVNGQWLNNQYTYTAFNVSGSQGVLTTPTPGSSLPGSSVTFGWTAGAGASAYWLDLGSVPGGNQYYQSGNLGNVLTTTVNGLPTNGGTVYATLYSQVGSQWLPNAYTYTASNQAGGLGVMQMPTPGSTLYGSTQTFFWSAGSGASAYWLDIGSTPGGNDYYQSGNLGNVQWATVNTLPANGSQIYVTLWSLVGGQWLNNQYTYLSMPVTAVSIVTSLIVDRSGSEAGSGGGEAALQAAVPQFVQYFTQGRDYVSLVSYASTSSLDVPSTTQFVTPIDNAVANMTFIGGNFGTGAGTNPIYSESYGPPLSMADYQNNSANLPPGTSESKAVVYFTDEVTNTIQDQFSCTNLGATLYSYGGYDPPATQFDFFNPSNNNQSTNDLSSHYSGTTSGSGGCSNGTTGLCEGNPPWSAAARCLGVTQFFSQQYNEPESFSRANIAAEAQWRALHTAYQMRSESPVPTYVYVIGLGTEISSNECTEAFLATLANDPNGPEEYSCPSDPAGYNSSLPAGLFLVVPTCPSQACTEALDEVFQFIASRLL